MDRKYITLIILMFLILFSFVLAVSESTNSDLNTKVNKSGDTMTNALHVPVVSNENGNYFTSIDLDPLNYLRLTISDDHGLNAITMEGDKTTFSQKIDMNGNNITNCPNCGGGADDLTWQNSKVNKSGNETITGDIKILNAYLNVTTNKTMNFDFNSIPMLKRNQSSATYRTALLTALNMMLEISDGGIGNGGGPAITFFNKENQSRGGAELNIGRFGIGWDNKVSNTSKYSFYYRSSVADTSALSPAFYVYGNGTQDFSTTRPATFETGNLKLTNKTGIGYEFACFDSNGNLIRSSVSCDLI